MTYHLLLSLDLKNKRLIKCEREEKGEFRQFQNVKAYSSDTVSFFNFTLRTQHPTLSRISLVLTHHFIPYSSVYDEESVAQEPKLHSAIL